MPLKYKSVVVINGIFTFKTFPIYPVTPYSVLIQSVRGDFCGHRLTGKKGASKK